MLEVLSAWKDQLYSTFIEQDRYMMLLDGFKNTMIITICALLIGVAGRLDDRDRQILCGGKPGAQTAGGYLRLYVTAIRGIPVVVLLLIFYFLILKSADGIVTGIVTFGLNSGAYTAEIIRGGIMSIDAGQSEAGRSLGFNYIQTMYYIVMPQTIKTVLPALGNELVVLLKETSIAGYIAMDDLTKGGNIIRSITYNAFLPLLAVALIYLVVVLVLSYGVNCLERRLRNSATNTVPLITVEGLEKEIRRSCRARRRLHHHRQRRRHGHHRAFRFRKIHLSALSEPSGGSHRRNHPF